jgi:hypothetical protein
VNRNCKFARNHTVINYVTNLKQKRIAYIKKELKNKLKN